MREIVLVIEGSISSILSVQMDKPESVSNCYECESSDTLLAAEISNIQLP